MLSYVSVPILFIMSLPMDSMIEKIEAMKRG